MIERGFYIDIVKIHLESKSLKGLWHLGTLLCSLQPIWSRPTVLSGFRITSNTQSGSVIIAVLSGNKRQDSKAHIL